MKPIYLEFCGINSFSETAKIDFKALLSGGVFGIFGDTGSGKSTILDAIHFALYGEIDRVPKSFNDCINYRSEGASVTFDFELTTEGARHSYRVKRERKRKNGTTKAYLYEYTNEGGQLALAEGTREVDERLERIIGLSFTDFKTCIALPQGDFAALVKSTTGDRVKLVARLFNLEKYGEKLSKAVNERYHVAEEEVNLIKAKMGENEGGRDELMEETQAKITAEKSALAIAKSVLDSAEKAYREAEELSKAKHDFESLRLKLQTLQRQLPEMEQTQKQLSVLPKAQAVAEKSQELKTSEGEERTARENAVKAQEALKNAERSLANAKQKLEEGNYEEKILNLSLDLQKVQSLDAEIKAAETAKTALDKCIAEFNALKSKCPEEDFQAERDRLEKEIAALGEDDTLLAYLKRNCKEVLLVDAYGEIRADLKRLGEKYPQTQTDIQTLVEKYSAKNAVQNTDSFDIATINLAFKEIERKRKHLREKLAETDKRQMAFHENESKKKLLIEQGRILREGYTIAAEKIALVKDMGTASELAKKLDEWKKEWKEAKERLEEWQNQTHALHAEREKQTGLAQLYKRTREKCETALAACLQESGFSSVAEAQRLIETLGGGERAMQKCQAFFEEYAHAKKEHAKTDASKFTDFDETALARATQTKAQARERLDRCHQTLGALEKELGRLLALKEKYKEQAKLLAEKEKHKNLCDELRSLVKSNKFLEFIASEYLQEICGTASKTLLSLTSGRYFLKYDKEFKVGDNLDGGNLRGVKTLSGGETFLVSLSLALSLSAAICLKSLRPIEFFFLDEGFGTLDEKLVDTVMDVLGKLSRTFSVGLISHVEELKHRIDHKIVVTGANEKHGSQVKVECF